MAYKLRNKNSVGMMASSPLYNTPKPDRAEYDSQEAYDQAMVAYDRSQTPDAKIPDATGSIKEKGTPVVKGAMRGSSGPNVQFGGDGRRILKSGGGDVGAGSGTGGGKNQNIIGVPKDPYFGGRGVGSGLTSSFAGTAKLGTTFKPQPLVIPKAKTQDKKVKKTTTKSSTGSTSSKSSTGPSKPVKKGPASTSTKPMEGLISLGGSEMASKIQKTVDAARSSSNDLIKNNLDGGGRVGRVRRRQQKRTANLQNRLQNRAEIQSIRQSERGKRQSMRESASQERKDLLTDMPVDKDATGGRKSTSQSKLKRKTKRQLRRSDRFSEKLGNVKPKRVPTRPGKNVNQQPKARLEKQTPAPVIDKPIKVRKLKDTSRYGGTIDRSSAALDQKARAASDVSFGNEVIGAKNMTYNQPSATTKSNKNNRVMADKGGFDYPKGGKSKRSKKNAQRTQEARKYGI